MGGLGERRVGKYRDFLHRDVSNKRGGPWNNFRVSLVGRSPSDISMFLIWRLLHRWASDGWGR